MEFSYIVGQHEPHRIDFSWNQMWGTSSVRIDGQPVAGGLEIISPIGFGNPADPTIKTWSFGPLKIQLVKRWDFWVGFQERHFVRIEKERAKWFAGFLPHTYRLFVDGYLMFERSGY